MSAIPPSACRRRLRPAAARRRAVRPVLGALGACLLVACSSGPSEARRMRAALEPYLDEVAAYDRWARRLGLADAAFRSEAALREAAFAPLRRERRVAAAWLQRRGPDARTLRHPEDAPALPEDGWVRVVTEDLGELHAQRRRLRIAGREREWILIRRSRPAPGGATLHVTLACAPPEPSEE